MTNRSARNPAFMRAAFIRTLGGPDAIEYGHLPVPAPGPEDVLLRMEAVAVNHVDLLIRSGAYATQLEFPFIVGRDVVGTVQAVGSDVRSLAPGDRAWSNSLGHAGRQGSFSEFVLAAAERVYRLPAGVTAEKAVAVLHGGATAYLGLVREACLIAVKRWSFWVPEGQSARLPCKSLSPWGPGCLPWLLERTSAGSPGSGPSRYWITASRSSIAVWKSSPTAVRKWPGIVPDP